MSLKTTSECGGAKWAEDVVASLRACGYFYDRNFSSRVDSGDVLVRAASSLGSVLIPPGTDPKRPVLLTHPSNRAPEWRPFDRPAPIGWHSDFSTWTDRPVLSLSWIRRQDPAGPDGGAWRVASVRAVLSKLADSAEGRTLVDRLPIESHPFGYRDAGRPRFFCMLSRMGLRFYGRALTEGARVAFDKVPPSTREAIALVERAADAVGETLPASTGSLLVVHNWSSLHDRTEQTVVGAATGGRRQAWLCFVKRLHRLLTGPDRSLVAGAAQEGKR